MDTASHESSGDRLGHIFDFFPGSYFSGFPDVRLRPLGPTTPVSRRDECISTARVRPGSAPRGPGDIWELFSEVGL